MDYPAQWFASRGTTYSLLEQVKDFGALVQWSAKNCANKRDALDPEPS